MAAADARARIGVEVVYATPSRQTLVELQVAAGTTAAQAIDQSGIRNAHPEIGAGQLSVGIFGRTVPPDSILQQGDRVEIYRPLAADPKEARRSRAAIRSPRGKRRDRLV